MTVLPALPPAAAIADIDTLHRTLNAGVDWNRIRSDWRDLIAIRDWAYAQLPIASGDPARIVAAVDTDNGWRSHRESLTVGATGTVGKLYVYKGTWRAHFTLDRCWQVFDNPRESWRLWCGKASGCPDGMRERSAYDQERYPEGKRHTFVLSADQLGPIDPE